MELLKIVNGQPVATSHTTHFHVSGRADECLHYAEESGQGMDVSFVDAAHEMHGGGRK